MKRIEIERWTPRDDPKCTNCSAHADFVSIENDHPHPYPSGERRRVWCRDHLRREMETDQEFMAQVLASFLVQKL